ncbi:MAG TPA: sugar phosphate nucleotidyltransferase [Thermoanaerobaculia bacterium]|nr:sugar phosphate nucleotidyltransferase [Thermoanaerobaculia bacterium]
MSRPRARARGLRALVLAAGEGVRLRPLTDDLPKPLLPVAGRTVLDHTLDALLAAGCEAAAVNLFHLGDKIRARYGDAYRGMPLVWSHEVGERQGTLGALHPLKGFLAEADAVVLVNGDTLCPWPLDRMLRRHRAAGAAATLLLTTRVDPAGFAGGVGVDKEGRVLSFWQGAAERGTVARRAVFAGAHVLDPRLLDRVEAGPADVVRKLYVPMLEEGGGDGGGRVQAIVSHRRWHDLGTPRRYLEGVLDWGRGGWPERAWRRSWTSPEARVEAGARTRGAVVEAGATVGAGAVLERAVVLAGARVAGGARVRESVVGPGVQLPAEASVEGRLITAYRDGVPIHPSDSQVGGLVYTPLDAVRRATNPGL